MKKLLFISLFSVFIAAGIFAGSADLPTIAIMDVAATNTSEVKSQVIYEYIVDVVNRSGRYSIVERSALQKAIKEMEISTSGMVDDSTAAKIGKLAGAQYILISNLINDDGIIYLSTRIVSVETGRVQNTAMLQAEKDEYIASLANRTISQLLGVEVQSNTETTATTEPEPEKKTKTAVQEPASGTEKKEQKTEVSAQPAGAVKQGKLSLVIKGNAIIPILDDGEIFKIGYGLTAGADFRIKSFGKLSLSAGVNTGLFLDSTKKEVVYPYTMMNIPLSAGIKLKLNTGKFFLALNAAGGGALSIFSYSGLKPAGTEKPITVINPAIFPGLSAGYMITPKIGVSVFGDWSMIFFKQYPYTAVNAGIAAAINL